MNTKLLEKDTGGKNLYGTQDATYLDAYFNSDVAKGQYEIWDPDTWNYIHERYGGYAVKRVYTKGMEAEPNL